MSGGNQLMPNLAIFVVPGEVDWSTALSRCARGAMKTVIGWLKFTAIVCSVASGSAANEGRCTTAAGFPPSSRSVNALLMLKVNFCGGQVSMAIVQHAVPVRINSTERRTVAIGELTMM